MAESKPKKMFVITAQDGSEWAFGAEVVAHNRAKYYAKEDPDTTYADEYEYTLNDPYELSDWLGNNMNYEDVAKFVQQISGPCPINLEAAIRDGKYEERERPESLLLPLAIEHGGDGDSGEAGDA